MHVVDMTELTMRFRRMMRTSKSHAVVNVTFSRFPAIVRNPRLLRVQLNGVDDLAGHFGAECYAAGRTDAFVIFPGDMVKHAAEFIDRVLACAIPEGSTNDGTGEEVARIYRVPEDYAALRQRLEGYGGAEGHGAADAGSTAPAEDAAVQASPAAPLAPLALLTPSLVAEINACIAEQDMRRFVRSQAVYQGASAGARTRLYREYFIGIDDLQRKLFPKLDLYSDRGLFHEICRALDIRMLAALDRELNRLPAGRIGLNLCLETLDSEAFETLLQRLKAIRLPMPVLEISVHDFITDLRRAEATSIRLRGRGCAVVLDGVTLDMVKYLNVDRFSVDLIKFYAHKEHFSGLGDAADLDQLRRVSGKAVFCHCDHQSALSIGQAIGIDKYQGWLLDGDVRPATLMVETPA